MPLPRLPRLELALGTSLEQLSVERLEQLFASAAVFEDYDLDFKASPYGSRDEDKRELAKDLSAMANTQGGAILIGVEEANGAGSKITNVAFDESEVMRMRQVLASLVAPFLPGVEIKFVGRSQDSTKGVYIVAVQKSSWAPHAVRHGESLRFHQRDGAKTRALSENEVAELYRNRFSAAQAQVEKLDEIFVEGKSGLAGDKALFLSVALVPNIPGKMTISGSTEEQFRNWANGLWDKSERRRRTSMLSWSQSVTGFQRIVLSDAHQEQQAASFRHAELHADGSGFYAENVFWLSAQNDPQFWDAVAWRTAAFFHDQLLLLCEHAARHCGVLGDGVLLASLVPIGEGSRIRFLRPGSDGPQQPRRSLREPKPSRHTVSIDALAYSGKERLILVRRAMTDLLQQFGIPEFDGISIDGRIKVGLFGTGDGDVERWAAANGLEIDS